MKMHNQSKITVAVACTFACTLSTFAAFTFAASTAMTTPAASLPATAGSSKNNRYIVTFKPGAYQPTHYAANIGGQRAFNVAAAAGAIEAHGAKVKRTLARHHAIAAHLTPQAVRALRKNPNVTSVDIDPIRRFNSLYNDSPGNPNTAQITPYAVVQSQADQLSLQSGIKVCVIDSGLDTSNPDFAWGNISGDDDPGTGNWDDNGGAHGTHVAGTVGAADNGFGVIGMAPGVALHIIKVFNASGWGYSSDLAHAADLCSTAGANIITMSLGGGGHNKTEENAFDAFTDNGGLVLAAAGNDGNSARSYPGGYPAVMMIGANDADNNIAAFSQFPGCRIRGRTDDGHCVEVTAGGVNTLSTYPSQAALGNAGAARWATATADGTDMAAIAMENSGMASAAPYFMGIANTTDSAANGRICVIDRGQITFHDKVKNCEDSGGMGAVIVNNVAGVLSGTLGETNTTTIPAVGAALADRNAWINAATIDLNIEPSLYGFMNGTSMATPAVAGVAALVWSAHQGDCSGSHIRQALKASAEDAGAAGKDVHFGYGIVKAKAADDYLLAHPCSDGGTPPGGIDVTVGGISIRKNRWVHYALQVDADYATLTFSTTGGSGNADLYVRYGATATTSSYDCRSASNNNEESCIIDNPAQGNWYIGLKANNKRVSALTLNVTSP